MHPVIPCLWFATEAEDAAAFYVSLYVSLLEESTVDDVSRSGEGLVISVSFRLRGQQFLALNGNADRPFTQAVSFQLGCDTQDEVDRLWGALSEGGEELMCGWVTDRFGVSWQVAPTALPLLLGDPDPARAQRALQAMLGMRKLDVARLEAAAAG